VFDYRPNLFPSEPLYADEDEVSCLLQAPHAPLGVAAPLPEGAMSPRPAQLRQLLQVVADYKRLSTALVAFRLNAYERWCSRRPACRTLSLRAGRRPFPSGHRCGPEWLQRLEWNARGSVAFPDRGLDPSADCYATTDEVIPLVLARQLSSSSCRGNLVTLAR
jgi:hypothetical protein